MDFYQKVSDLYMRIHGGLYRDLHGLIYITFTKVDSISHEE